MGERQKNYFPRKCVLTAAAGDDDGVVQMNKMTTRTISWNSISGFGEIFIGFHNQAIKDRRRNHNSPNGENQRARNHFAQSGLGKKGPRNMESAIY